MTIPQLLEERAQEFRSKPFILCDDAEYSYAFVNEMACRAAANLAKRGVGFGDKVVTLLGNGLEILYLLLGLGRIGAVAVPVNPQLKPDEVAHIVANSDAATLVAASKLGPVAKEVLGAAPHIKRVYAVGEPAGEYDSFEELLAPVDSVPPVAASPHDDAALIYTSGTTGLPKGVRLSHANYVWNAHMIRQALDFWPKDRFFCVLPLFHVNAQVISVLSPLLLGCDVLLMRQFAPFNILPWIEKYRPTVLSVVPTIYSVLCRLAKSGEYDTSAMRFFVTGAAPITEDLYHQTSQVFKRPLIAGYGLSEATCATAAMDPDLPVKWNSVGPPLRHNRVRIVDDEGHELPAGEVGEITIAGPNVMKGYYRNAAATHEALRNGWLHTGDLGRFDEDGYLYVEGTKKEMIIRGGFNVYPQQIENAMMSLAGVEECCVVGVDEPRWGQEIVAVVKRAEGATLDGQQVLTHCRKVLAPYKCPRHVRFVDEFPKTATGKIKKNEVAGMLAGAFHK